jgi:hypothetical protein
MNTYLKYSHGPVATRKFLTFVHICGERMEVVWQEVVMLMSEYFDPRIVWHKKYTAVYVGQYREVELTYKA